MPPEQLVYHQEVLSNGLCLVWRDMPQARLVHFAAFAKGGKLYETAANHGISHFLEHLHLSSTRSHPTRAELLPALDSCHGQLKGYTCPQQIVLEFSAAPPLLARAAELFAGIIEVRSYPDDIVESERSLLVDELQSNSYGGFHTMAEAQLFGQVPFGLQGGGSPRTLRALTRTILHEFDRRAFSADRLVVIVAGRLDSDGILACRRSFERVPLIDSEPLVCPSPPPPPLPQIRRFRAGGTHSYALSAFLLAPDPTPLDCVCTCFFDQTFFSMSSRLAVELRWGRAHAYHVEASSTWIAGQGILYLWGNMNFAERATFFGSVFEECRRLRDGDIAQSWFENGKAGLLRSIETGLDDPEAFARRIGGAREWLGLPSNFPIREELELIRNLSIDQLVEYAGRLFRPERLFVLFGARLPFASTRKIRDLVHQWL